MPGTLEAEPTPLFPEAGPSNAHLRPHLVEIIPEEQLRSVLHPVFRYVLTYLAQHYPRYFLRIVNRHEEAFALVLLLLERHHLWKHDASLSEHFYHLKLAPATIPTPRLGSLYAPKARLSNKQRWGMLLVLVGLPYLRARADDAYERWSSLADPELVAAFGDEQSQPLSRVQRLFVNLYPAAVTAFEGTLLAYDFAYLFNKTDAYRPWHKWLGVRVQRAHDEDNSDSGLLARLPPLLPPLLLALKFAQWWYSPTSPRSLPTTQASTSVHTAIRPPRALPLRDGAALANAGILTPPTTPPPGEQPDAQAYAIDALAYGLCPLCRGKWANPAILPSGWVVCWRCGWDAIAGEGEAGEAGRGRCPITGVEVRPEDLRRVLV